MEDKEYIHKEVEPWGNGKVKSENGKLSTPSVATLLVSSSPDVKLGSLTLIRHKMTSSHFSKGLIRPVSGGQSMQKTDLRSLMSKGE